MIYTVTFNPSLDYVVYTNELKIGETNRSYRDAIFAGGKGINVSMILHRLGVNNTALGFVAGFTGSEIEREVQRAGLCSDFIYVKEGNSRINIKLKHGDETEINGLGPMISDEAVSMLFQRLQTLQDDDWLVISGSIPQSLPSDMYEQILQSLPHKKIHVVVDATNELLRRVLKYHPFLIKPNHRELEALFQVEIHNEKELIHYGKKLQEEGAVNVLISRAKDGAILIAENGHIYQCDAPKGKTVNSVGAGDAMVAGFIAGYLQTHNYEEAICMGSAAGGATAFEEQLADKGHIMEVREYITCRILL